MDKFIAQFATLDWWLNAVALTIIFGIISAYAKDWLSSALAVSSRKYRAIAAENARKRDARTTLLVNDPTLLVVAHIRVVQYFLLVLTFAAVAIGLPAYVELAKHFPGIDPMGQIFTPPIAIPYLLVVFSGMSMAATLWMQQKLSLLVSDTKRARAIMEDVTQKRLDAFNAARAAREAGSNKL
ncbi:hypothetical protein ACSFA8_19145 [Variovorax sp. RT4R15]|uniref:hypothetical protein n=1 Tax=Variovorax sp. RT4R15 TaxID=3443737 RepID=UPI003F47F236